jgi:hypothetical protein
MKSLFRTAVAVVALSLVAPAFAANSGMSGGSEKTATEQSMKTSKTTHKRASRHHARASTTTPAKGANQPSDSGSTGSSAKSPAK